MKRIYLDHNSTTPIDPSVAKAIYDCHLEQFANPASQHQSGQRTRRQLESTRNQVLQMIGANSAGMNADQLVFTSGGTESNNLALLGLVGETAGRVLVSSIEHPSIFGPAELLSRKGFEVISTPVTPEGRCDVDRLAELINPQTRLVSLMLANNETGVIQPVQAIAQICRQQGVVFHCDATQAMGKMKVNFAELGVSAMTFSAHKFHGPRGIGALVLKSGTTPQPIHFGGFQQMGIRPGTEDLALAIGMTRAMELWQDDSESGYAARYAGLSTIRDRMESILVERYGAVVNGAGTDRLGHTCNISLPGIDRQAFLLAADMSGLDISTGSACASGSSEPSPVLLAMGLPDAVVESSLRISLGVGNSESEIEEAIERIGRIVAKLRTNK